MLAAELANRLDGHNRERREIEAQTLQAVIEQVEARPQSPSLVFAAAEGWHPGVIGIVAARLKERYERLQNDFAATYLPADAVAAK